MSQGTLIQTEVDSKGTAFIAMPFHSHFNTLETAIRNAVLQAGFFPYRTDKNIVEKDWHEAIYLNTKRAAIFIAVCTPEPTTKVPNPNVMYELGWADCLGTPTIILTTDPKNLPSDLRTQNVLTYSGARLKAFEGQLCSWVLARTGSTARLNALAGHLLPQSLALLDFVKKIHHSFQLLSTLDDLKKIVEEGLTKAAPDDSAIHRKSCQQAWEQYVRVYELVQAEFLGPCNQQRVELERAFLSLEPAITAGPYAKLRRYYEELKHMALELFPDLHRKVSEEPGRNPRAFAGSSQELMELWPRLETMSRTAREIVGVADNLIFILIGLMTRNGRNHA